MVEARKSSPSAGLARFCRGTHFSLQLFKYVVLNPLHLLYTGFLVPKKECIYTSKCCIMRGGVVSIVENQKTNVYLKLLNNLYLKLSYNALLLYSLSPGLAWFCTSKQIVNMPSWMRDTPAPDPQLSWRLGWAELPDLTDM